MSRRLFSRWIVFVVVACLVGCLPSPSPAPVRGTPTPVQPAARPNIVFILTDDQRWDTLDYMPVVKSQLMPRAFQFTQAFVTTPECCPSRSSILTGLYAHHHGTLTNAGAAGGAEIFHKSGHEASTLGTWLHAAGYRTGMIGKYLNNYDGSWIPPGWDTWSTFLIQASYYNYQLNENGKIVAYGAEPQDYSTDVLAKQVVDFLAQPGDAPFFLYFAPKAPHDPFTPPPRYENSYATLDPWRPASFNQADVSASPDWIRSLPMLTTTSIAQGDAARIQQLESLLAVDDAVAAILKQLEQAGKLDHTFIIFTSDNGLSWGEHRWYRKSCGFDECVRVPLLILGPGITPGHDDHFALNIDLAPTMAELAGVTPPAGLDGTSLVPLLRGQSPGWRNEFIIEQWLEDIVPSFEGLRTTNWTYLEYDTGERELYDLVADPYELHSLAAEDAQSGTIETLHNELQALLKK